MDWSAFAPQEVGRRHVSDLEQDMNIWTRFIVGREMDREFDPEVAVSRVVDLASGKEYEQPSVFFARNHHPDERLLIRADGTCKGAGPTKRLAQDAALLNFAKWQSLTALWYCGHYNEYRDTDFRDAKDAETARRMAALNRKGVLYIMKISVFTDVSVTLLLFESHDIYFGTAMGVGVAYSDSPAFQAALKEVEERVAFVEEHGLEASEIAPEASEELRAAHWHVQEKAPEHRGIPEKLFDMPLFAYTHASIVPGHGAVWFCTLHGQHAFPYVELTGEPTIGEHDAALRYGYLDFAHRKPFPIPIPQRG